MSDVIAHFAGRPVIVGSGLAGLMTALSLSPEPSVIITHNKLGVGTSTAWAQGGIAVALAADDSTSLHLADTLAAGDGLCDHSVAKSIVADAAEALAVLERLGVRFDHDAKGALAFGLESAHSRRRIVHVAGDGSGAAIIHALAVAAVADPAINIIENAEARALIISDGAICGLLVTRPDGDFVLRTARVLLATGGIGGLYDATTNPAGNFGQGIALAARAGAALADMEFVQFHPTALDSRRRPLALISEAVRGEGAKLINEQGKRFMADIPGAELAPRDIVARAISAEIARGGRVFLDARCLPGTRFACRFPMIAQLCQEAAIDPSKQPIPVRPAVHYHMGGVATDLEGRSSVPGLWLAGEAASTGFHGANRLASNSLLEAAVMGMRAARSMAGARTDTNCTLSAIPSAPKASSAALVRPPVSRHLGVFRNAAGIHRAISHLLPLVEEEGSASDPAVVAMAIAVFASLREESRGAHARTDFPLKQPLPLRRIMTWSEVLEVARNIAVFCKEYVT